MLREGIECCTNREISVTAINIRLQLQNQILHFVSVPERIDGYLELVSHFFGPRWDQT